jgi:outer membrane protein assembly factor BamB
MQSMSRHPYRTLSVLSVLLACALLLTGIATADDWPHWRGPDRTGISKETGWSPKAPAVLWRAKIGVGFSSFSVADGLLYTMGNVNDKDIVYCFDAETGKENWKYSYPCARMPKLYEGGPNATPTVDGEKVYTLSKAGYIACLGAADGQLLWSKKVKAAMPKWGFSGSALIAGDTVIFNVGPNGLALNKMTGEPVWASGNGAAGYATPVPFVCGDTPALAMFSKASLLAVATRTGKVLWELPWVTRYDVNAADPVVSGDTIFISSGYDHGCAMVKFTGAGAFKVWENKNMRNHFNSTVLWEGYLYGFDEKTLKCLDPKTGDVKWAQKDLGKGSLILADGKLIVLSEKGKLVIAPPSPDGFTPVSELQVFSPPTRTKCWTAPVLANGRIYARKVVLKGKESEIVCIDVKAK